MVTLDTKDTATITDAPALPACAMCFDIGGSTIKAALAHGGGADPVTGLTPLGRQPTPLNDLGDFAAAIEKQVELHAPDPALPISISITGVIDPETGILTCANIPCVDGIALADRLAERLGRPVQVNNDAACFTIAEARRGAGRGYPIVFGAILGTGVGGGLVINGRLVQGAGGFAGEWGHGPIAATLAGDPPVDIPRFACGCGQKGCVDTIGGARGLERLHTHLHGKTLTSREIIDQWNAGHQWAERTVEVFVDLVSAPLATVVNIVGAHIVPVGGGLARAENLIERIDEEVRKKTLYRFDRPLVVRGDCQVEPGLVGAALIATGA